MPKPPQARWWALRRARNRKPVTYRCPLCGGYLPSLRDHVLMTPEGDASRRRHAHIECVIDARRRGQLPTHEEWLKTQPRPPSRWRGLVQRLTHREP